MEISKRKTFSQDEDEILKKFVKENGNRNWGKISSILQGRTPRQCRDRYRNYLKEGLNSHPWTEEEDSLIKKMHNNIGPKWVAISKMLNDRNGIDVKKRWCEINANSKMNYKLHDTLNLKHDFSLNSNSKTFINPSEDSKPVILKDKIYTNQNDVKKDNDNNLSSNNHHINNNNFNIAISEEEFYDILSIMNCILPIEEYNVLNSAKVLNMF